MMRGIVFGNTVATAKRMIEDIKSNYDHMQIECTKEINNSQEIAYEFANGDYWRTARASESSRGLACNIAYIDKNIPLEIERDVILPCVKCYPWTGVHYYE